MKEHDRKKKTTTTIALSATELNRLDRLTEEVNALADYPRRVRRTHVIRAILALAKNISAARVLQHLQF